MSRLLVFAAGVALLSGTAIAGTAPTVRDVAPTGSLRVAIGVGPAASEFWATHDATSGAVRGVTVDLAKAAAAKLQVPLQLVEYANSGEIAAAGSKDAWDISFMPADVERAKYVDHGPPYVVYISSYLIRSGSPIGSLADVDRPENHVGCVEGTSTSRTVAKALKQAALRCYATAEEAAQRLGKGELDALAMGRGALRDLSKTIPGSRLLDEAVQTTNVVVVVPKNHAAAGAWAATFVEEAKSDGTVRRALDHAGFVHAEVAPSAR